MAMDHIVGVMGALFDDRRGSLGQRHRADIEGHAGRKHRRSDGPAADRIWIRRTRCGRRGSARMTDRSALQLASSVRRCVRRRALPA